MTKFRSYARGLDVRSMEQHNFVALDQYYSGVTIFLCNIYL